MQKRINFEKMMQKNEKQKRDIDIKGSKIKFWI